MLLFPLPFSAPGNKAIQDVATNMLRGNGMGVYFGMGAYKQDVVIVITIGAYIHGCLFCVSTVHIIPIYGICIYF